MEGDWPDEAEDSDETKAFKRLLKVAKIVNERCVIANDTDDEIAMEFDDAITDVESILFPEDDDPRSMGWVGDDGLP
jgi:hypothetical protein